MTQSYQREGAPGGPSISHRFRPILYTIFWVCFCSLPVLAVGGWVLWSASSAVERASRNLAQGAAASTMETLDRLLLGYRGDLLMLAGMPAVKGLEPAALVPALDQLVTARHPAYRLALVADARGQILAVNRVDGEGRSIASGTLIGQTVAQEPWFQDLLRTDKQILLRDVRPDPLTQIVFGNAFPLLSMSAPIKDDAGAVVGALSVRVALAPLQDVVTHRQPHSDGGMIALVLSGADNQAIAASDHLAAAAMTKPPLVTLPAAGFAAASGLQWHLDVYAAEDPSALPTSHLAWLGFGLSALLASGLAVWAGRRQSWSRETRPGGSATEATQAEREQQIIFDSVPAMVFYKDRNNRILRANRAAAASVGKPVEEVEGKLTQELWPDEADRYYRDDMEVMESGKPKVGIVEPYRTASGEKRWVRTDKIPYRDDQGAIIGVIVFAVDITEQAQAEETLRGAQQALEAKVRERTAELSRTVESLQREASERKKAETELDKSEQQVRQLQRMEAVGHLAGDIAHDFNNLLTIILGHSELLRERLEPQAPLFQPLDEITKAAEQASTLIQHLLAFSRKQPRQLQRLNLNQIIETQVPVLERLLGERHQLVTALSPDLGLVLADAAQIEQVLLNLLLNARDAMPAGGTVTIETRNVTADKSFVQRHIRSKPGAYVMLAVTDTGVGMDDYVQAHCFDPFFTTKPKGVATGLGLSIVYGVVKQNEGLIEIVSAPGRGATLKVYFPYVEAQAAVPAAADPVSRKVPRGTETLLLVEDEPGLRMLLCRVLEQQGYRVLDAPSGSVALGVASKHQGPIHLLVTDVVMPEMNGTELARLVSAARPEMRVLYISGYPDGTAEDHGVPDPQTTMLQKPFSPERFARKVRDMLDQRTEGASPGSGA